MPIRFRCAYCNQLLGIARRKAGTVVRCPGCSGQVVVPSLEEAGLSDKTASPSQRTAPANPPEVNEVDKALEGAAGDQPSVVEPGHGPVFASQAAPGRPAPSVATRGQGMIYLTPARATLLSVIAVVTLAVVFGLGLLTGLMLAARH